MIYRTATLAVLLGALTQISTGQGTVSLSSTAPATDILSSNDTGTTWSRIIDEDIDTNHARGMIFSLGDGAMTHYEITAITIHKNGAQTFSNDTMTLRIYEGSSAQWEAGTGHSTATDGDDYYVDTTVTPLYLETFTVDGTIAGNSYVTFELTVPLTVNENSDFGFFFTYDESASSSPDHFQYNEGSNGGRTSITTTDHGVSSRHLRYFVQGSASGGGDPDSDDDGLPDVWEYLHFKDLDEDADGNPDGDGVDNAAELAAGTDPNDADSDDDGLDDDVEIAGPTDPLDSDSDDDQLLDGVETGSGIFVSTADTGTNAMLADTDDDGVPDGTEIGLGTDPSDITHQPTERPNMIFIMVDDLDLRELGAYGQTTLQTPRVDAMASQGMLFTDYYTASPVCQPSRSCLMTGQDARRSQDKHNASGGDGYQYPLHPSRVTIAEVLKQAGYTTGCVGKWGIGGPTSGGAPWDQGFDFFCGELGQVQAHRFFPKFLWKNGQKIYFNQALATSEGGSLYIPGANNPNGITHDWTDAFGNVCSHDVAVAEGLQFIEDNADKPFFLYCAWTPPHSYKYAAATLDALTDTDGLVYDPVDLDQTLINSLYPGAPFGGTPESPDFDPHTYASMVSAIDRDTGRIMDKLVERGIDDKTLVIFCSDNGGEGDTFLTPEHLEPGIFNYRGAKKDTYEGGIRCPFVAWWPGQIQGGTTTGVVGTFADMLPTFAEMAGVSTPPQITGRSILPVLLGGSEDDLQFRSYHYWYFTESSNGLNRRWRAVRQGDWKIVRDRATDGSPPTYELFNLVSDPTESTDRSSTEADILARLIPLVEGTHEVTVSTYFKADDEFFTWSNLARSFYQIDTPDGSGAANGYSLTPSGTGSCFNYLPFETGLVEAATFTWTMEFPSGGAASLLLGDINDPAQCLAVRIEPATLNMAVSYGGSTAASATLAAVDVPGARAECSMRIDPVSGAGEVTVGSTVLAFDLATDIGPLRFWGYEVETSTVKASRPRWSLGASGEITLEEGSGIIDASYQLPFSPGQSATPQFSIDMKTWFDNPPGLLDSRSTNSQGTLQGTWHLPQDSLLPRYNDRLFLRAVIKP